MAEPLTLHSGASAETVREVIHSVSPPQKFTVQDEGPGRYRVRRGSLGLSIFAGAFVAYCNFVVHVAPEGEGTRVTLQPNSPWWTGLIGVGRVKKVAKALLDGWAAELQSRGHPPRA